MSRYEFKVLPAPRQARKITGYTPDQDAYSATLTAVINEMGQEGWEFIRAEAFSTRKRWRSLSRDRTREVLVFRRAPKLAPARVSQARTPQDRVSQDRTARVPRDPEAVARIAAGARKITPRRDLNVVAAPEV